MQSFNTRNLSIAAIALVVALSSAPLLATSTPVTSTRSATTITSTLAQAKPQAQSLTLELARKALNAGKTAADKLKVNVSIAVLDAGGNLLAFERMDNSILASVEGSSMKAYTSVMSGSATKDLKGFVQPGAAFHGLETARFSKSTMFLDGGIPLRSNGVLIGAIGASGGSLEQDQQIAEAAVAALGLK
jgi:uncharacterized protein GlcG (DUF336 family)